MGVTIDFSGVRSRKPTQPGGNCLWCKFGKLDCENVPVKLYCRNRKSANYNKFTKFPHKKACKEWRYKFGLY